jgi:hypothetical protein
LRKKQGHHRKKVKQRHKEPKQNAGNGKALLSIGTIDYSQADIGQISPERPLAEGTLHRWSIPPQAAISIRNTKHHQTAYNQTREKRSIKSGREIGCCNFKKEQGRQSDIIDQPIKAKNKITIDETGSL